MVDRNPIATLLRINRIRCKLAICPIHKPGIAIVEYHPYNPLDNISSVSEFIKFIPRNSKETIKHFSANPYAMQIVNEREIIYALRPYMIIDTIRETESVPLLNERDYDRAWKEYFNA